MAMNVKDIKTALEPAAWPWKGNPPEDEIFFVDQQWVILSIATSLKRLADQADPKMKKATGL